MSNHPGNSYPFLSIVIPAFNEAARIGRTLQELRTYLPSLVTRWEVRVVDDGSADETTGIVASFARLDARIILQREPHRGKGAAVKAGMLAARGELRFLCDADLSMPVRELSRFLDRSRTPSDIVIGSREGPGATRVGEPMHRHVMGRLFNLLVQAAVLPGINDTQCGFKLFSARAVESIFPVMTVQGWAFDIEALVIARLRGYRVEELPIEWHYRDRSQVSPLRDPFRMFGDLWTIEANRVCGAYALPSRPASPPADPPAWRARPERSQPERSWR